MGSDRARRSYDESRQYRRVVPQQGRVVVEADGNEAQEIVTEEIRKEALDIVGPAGTPDDGYKISPLPGPEIPLDFKIGAGTMYVGGMRVALAEDAYYFQQPDWGIPDAPVASALEHVHLHLREQEVSAVEDKALREVALGGPDTAQRTRLIQRIERRAVMSSQCAGAWAQSVGAWEAKGLFFDPKTMRLGSHARLQVQFAPPPALPNLCAPEVFTGYLGAENQLLRVQVAAPGAPNAAPDKLLWAFDNASALYRVKDATVVDPDEGLIAITLGEAPVDAHHFPRAGQMAEALTGAVQLGPSGADGSIAENTGAVYQIVESYDPVQRRIVIKVPGLAGSLPKFIRIWEGLLNLTADTAIALGATGVRVTLTTPAGKPFVGGDHWLIGVRPKTPEVVYPRRLLDAPQPPDGPREWVCPLAVLQWIFPLGGSPIGSVLEDCRKHFDNLVTLTKKPPGCCTVTVWPEDLTGGTTLQSIVDSYIPVLQSGGTVKICLQAGEYAMSEPLRLAMQHENLRIEGCGGEVELTAAGGVENAFLDGMIVISATKNIRLRGLTLTPPNVNFDAAGGLLAGHTTAQLQTASAGAIDFRGLTVSVGVRIFSSHDIHVHDCTFALAVMMPSGAKSFYAGIFASGVCRGSSTSPPAVALETALDVQGCLFSSQGMLGSADHHVFGLLVTPMTTFQLSLMNTITSGTLVQPQIDNVLLRDNKFWRLTAPVFLSAETGLVRFEDNLVTECASAFWSVSVHALSRTDAQLETALGHASAGVPPVSALDFVGARNDPILTVGSAIGRAYPPPEGLTSWFPTTISGVIGTLPSLQVALASVEESLIDRSYFPTTIYLDLRITNNDIDTRTCSPVALAVWDTELGPLVGTERLPHPGEARLNNNRIVGDSALTAAAVIMVRRCTVTGNIVTNGGYYSLVVLGQETPPSAAITGNVLNQVVSLPDRGDVTLPTWISLNSLGA